MTQNSRTTDLPSQETVSGPELERLRASAQAALDAGDIATAWPHCRRLASLCETDAGVQMLAGCAGVAIGELERGAEFFARVVALEPDNPDGYHNLGLAQMRLGKYVAAALIFEAAISRGFASADNHHDLAVALSHAGRETEARRALRRALRLEPGHVLSREGLLELCVKAQEYRRAERYLAVWLKQTPADARLAQWRSALAEAKSGSGDSQLHDELATTTVTKALRIAVFASHDSFIKDISAHLAQRHTVRTFKSGNLNVMRELLEWCDVAWFEWCDTALIQATAHLPKLCPIICRLHSYEAFTDMPEQVDWSKVDRLVFVNESVQTLLEGRIPETLQTAVIHNAVDVEKFARAENRRHGKRIASVGYINYKKNPQLLVYCFKKIHDWDPEFELHIAGEHQDPRIRLYMQHLANQLALPITWHGWVADMPAFYEKMDFVISTSLFESFHYSVAEGMACGLTPLVHNWYGAERLYPREWLFNTPDECLALVQRALADDREAQGCEHRRFIETHYLLRDQLLRIDETIAEVSAATQPEERSRDRGLVSIIIPTYNRADFLPEAISSAANQSYPHCEIIVVDDGSTDETPQLLERFKGELGERLTVIRQDNRGVSAALNTAITHSRGQYISWLSSDDAYHPDKVWEGVRLLSERRDID
ncbi:MAG TPA: glycosyltransferase, partial [candidate division Zixibacteria bacterium]|nr:glycosyltransferase [candidate division Zixibacteria bacterium]